MLAFTHGKTKRNCLTHRIKDNNAQQKVLFPKIKSQPFFARKNDIFFIA